MITVCIPVYNSDVCDLVNALYEQGQKSPNKIEIIVIDDCSNSEVKEINSVLSTKITYIENKKNQGRACIRNQFLEYATMPFLLFIDGDSQIISNTFLTDYLQEIAKNEITVLCGASIYQEEKPARNYFLRWKYSVVRESKSLSERLKNPSLGFKTNNFIVRKDILQQVKFNETLLGYGHEDTLFGFELNQHGYIINHIDNPVLNKNLDDNTTFLNKTNEGLKSLLKVVEIVGGDEDFTKNIKLLVVHRRIKKNPVLNFFFSLSFVSLPILTFCLKKGFFTLRMFDAYKLFQLEKLRF